MESPAAYVYVLVNTGKSPCRSYVGWTLDLDRRLAQHNGTDGRKGGARSTRGHQWVLVYAEKCAGRGAALRREYRLKRDRALRAALRGLFA
jgi:putative endonuclease